MSELAVKNGTVNGRDGNGRFAKGNPGGPGRPRSENSITEGLRESVLSNPQLVSRILDLCQSEDERVALEAIKVVLNRLEPLPKEGAAANAQASVVNIIRVGAPDLGV